MLDAVDHAIEEGRTDDAQQILDGALEQQRKTIQSLRDLSFNIEPVTLRDQGFEPAVRALAEQARDRASPSRSRSRSRRARRSPSGRR